jgi:hypothetical protein
VTLFKLAIPAAYSTSCHVPGHMSAVLMFGLSSAPYGIWLCQTASYILMLPHRKTKSTDLVRLGASINFFYTALNVFRDMLSLIAYVAYSILLVRVARIWRGRDINSYEYVALTSILPTVRM